MSTHNVEPYNINAYGLRNKQKRHIDIIGVPIGNDVLLVVKYGPDFWYFFRGRRYISFVNHTNLLRGKYPKKDENIAVFKKKV